MSSMTRAAIISILALSAASTGAAQLSPPPPAVTIHTYPQSSPYLTPVAAAPYAYTPSYASSAVAGAIADWRRLRMGDGYSFASYANFLQANPGFPNEKTIRKSAEKAMRPGESAASLIYFFRASDPSSGNGWARLAEAFAASSRPSDALAAARRAWSSPDLSSSDESSVYARFGSQLTPTDYDDRLDALLFARKTGDALRTLGSGSSARRAAFSARIAMQQRSPDVETQYNAVMAQVISDAGLMFERARYLREANWDPAARQLLARQHAFTAKPTDPERFLDLMVSLARGASGDRQYALAYDISRQTDDLFPVGANMAEKSYAIRDDYTSLAWLGGTSAMQLGRAAAAVPMFDRYARGGKSLQVVSKGNYWAGRAAAQSGQLAESQRYWERAAVTPELFYSQLALERLGRVVPAPAYLPSALVTPAQRSAFQSRRLVEAVKLLGQQGYRSDQTLFIRALSDAVTTQPDRILATELATTLYRPDLAVWTARAARNAGSAFYYRPAFPVHSFANATGKSWSLVHGITRQESSFDRAVVSGASAMGMMQLLPGTAREQCGKMGIGYDTARLTSDPAFNVMLGSAYFQRLLGNWSGSYPLAVASYNAGSGNVRKWINAYGDPRSPGVDMINWIERIPFEETRGYVQRVLENSVVYDTINPTAERPSAIHLSTYLGKTQRPG